MQKTFHPPTPQRSTLPMFCYHDEHLLNELSPHILTVLSSANEKINLQMLHSPLPSKKDLFSQLIQSQIKKTYDDCFQNYRIPEEESCQFLEDFNVKESTLDQESEMMQDNESEEENEMKKRKRKSSAQIKILKQELELQPNWDKEKIAEISFITGLSQPQVYKWWWDQKKKSLKNEKENANKFLDKKLINRDFSKRLSQTQDLEHSEEDEQEQTFTKAKIVIQIEEIPETQKKVNKKLTFV